VGGSTRERFHGGAADIVFRPAGAATRLPCLNYGVIQFVHDGGNGAYHALSLKVTRRFGEGLSIVSSYTFAKSVDDTSGIRTQGFDTLFPQNSDCIRCERGLSSFDVRHRSVTSILYDLPIGKGKPLNIDNRVLNAVAGGWYHYDADGSARHAVDRRRGQRSYVRWWLRPAEFHWSQRLCR
jgi:hypothetical protein